jgi:hypothetical protein
MMTRNYWKLRLSCIKIQLFTGNLLNDSVLKCICPSEAGLWPAETIITIILEKGPVRLLLNRMNPPLSDFKGKALIYGRQSSGSQFDHIDSGSDHMYNRILWYSSEKNIYYPEQLAGNNKDENGPWLLPYGIDLAPELIMKTPF